MKAQTSLPSNGESARRFFSALLLPMLVLGSSPALARAQTACPVPATLTHGLQGPFAHVRYLADDAWPAVRWVRRGPVRSGLHSRRVPGVGVGRGRPGRVLFQSFQVQLGSVLGKENELSIAGRSMGLESDWMPFGFSSSGDVTGALVYGGPGVSMPGSEEDAYAQLELEGKIVVVEGTDPHGSGGMTMAGDPHYKASQAASRGAAAILVLLAEGAPLPDLVSEQRPSVRMPAGAITGAAAQNIRDAAKAGEEAPLLPASSPAWWRRGTSWP